MSFYNPMMGTYPTKIIRRYHVHVKFFVGLTADNVGVLVVLETYWLLYLWNTAIDLECPINSKD